ncbi:MAG TPA: PAS domain S-box protein, partial [Pirellulales bacterium]|nr:PAS domain S-box protein [Pirellulales bacterium]
MTAPTPDDLHELRRRLEEAEETLRAIQSGEVDALVLEGEEGAQVYTLRGADYPYRALIEAMQQGAVSLSGDGTILYCNRCFAEMVNTPQEKIIGAAAADFVPSAQRSAFEELLRQGRAGKSQGELQFRASEGPLLPVIVALSPLPLEGAVALCMVVTDLTERKQHRNLQEESRRKDEFLAMLA